MTGEKKTRYLPGLDGLRALAVVAVVLYHADVRWVPGGFLGVDVFLVISGFLITRLLLGEVAETGGIDLVGFWKRRARRLLPALWTLLVGVSVWMLVALPREVGRIRGDLAAALTYVTNWFLVATGRSYFDQFGRPSPLRHLWSLAVEEQFYLLWPLLFGWLLRRKLGRRGTLTVLLVGIAASSVLMAALFHPASDPSRVYYGTDTRAGGLLVGAAYAVWSRRANIGKGHRRLGSKELDALFLASLVGFGAIAGLVHDRDAWLYRGGFLVVSVVALVMVAAVAHPSARWSVRAMSTPVLRWIGLRSYAIYLWHWPVVVLTRPGVDIGWTGWPVLVLRLVITAALAELSWRFIEDPVRRGVVSRWWTNRRVRRRQMVGVVVGATAGVFGLCTAVIAHTPQVDEITASIQAGQAALDAQTEVPAALVTVAVDPAAEAKAKAVLARPNSRGPTTRSPVTTRPRSALATSVPTSSSQTPGLSSSQTPGLSSSQTPGPSTTQADRRPTGFGPTTLSVGGGSSEPDATTASPTTTVPAPTTTTIVVPRRVVHYAIPSLAVGDSVMLGSAPALKKTFGRSLLVDAKVGRQFETGLEVLEKLKKDGALGDVVIVHLGDNGAIKSKLLDRLLRDVADVPAVVIVAPKVPFAFETDQRALLYRRTQPMANVRVADWTSLAAAHPDFLYTDFVHLRPPGAKAYAELLAETIIRMCGPPDAGDATQPPLLLERCVARLPPDALVSTTTSPVSSTDPTAPAAETTPPS